MAHRIDKNDNFGFIGERSRIWHGLGLQIDEGLTAREAFPQIGLDWDTELLPVYADMGGQRIEVPSHRIHIRKDTQDVLGVVTDGYEKIENGQLADFVDALAGEDAACSVETAGSLYSGRKVFCLVKLPTIIKAAAEDLTDTYVCVSNGHGGFAAFSVFPTSVRVVCANTYNYADARDAGKGIKFRHSGDMADKIKQARTALGIALKETEKFQEKVTALVGVGLDVDTTRAFMEMAWEDCFGRINPEKLEKEALEKLTQKRDNTVAQWLAKMEEPNQQIKGIAGTAWAAFNSVTEWMDHDRGRFKSIQESDARAHSNLFGTSSADKTKVMRRALELV